MKLKYLLVPDTNLRKTIMKRKRLCCAIRAALEGAEPVDCQTVCINSRGLGEVVLFPYYRLHHRFAYPFYALMENEMSVKIVHTRKSVYRLTQTAGVFTAEKIKDNCARGYPTVPLGEKFEGRTFSLEVGERMEISNCTDGSDRRFYTSVVTSIEEE